MTEEELSEAVRAEFERLRDDNRQLVLLLADIKIDLERRADDRVVGIGSTLWNRLCDVVAARTAP